MIPHDSKQLTILMDMRYFLPLLFLAAGCGNDPSTYLPPPAQTGEYIVRKRDDSLYNIPAPQPRPKPETPWLVPHFQRITKYHFRCKGRSDNPTYTIEQKRESATFFDCDGEYHHSLPLNNGEEYIYPILIDLLNWIQEQSGHPVVITSGHRCPEHNNYVDPSPSNQSSKHLIGAEADFYVKGLERDPQRVVEWIRAYYVQHPSKNGKEFTEFQKQDSTLSKSPIWQNKEVLVKIVPSNEGRNRDNSHPYPYISIQVRWDQEKNEKVSTTWHKAVNNFYRR